MYQVFNKREKDEPHREQFWLNSYLLNKLRIIQLHANSFAKLQWARKMGQLEKPTIAKPTHKKPVPLQAWTGPQDSRRLRPPDFLTIGTWSWWVVSRTHRPLLPPGWSRYSFLEAESTPGHMELSDATGKIPGDTGNRSRDLPTCSAVP